MSPLRQFTCFLLMAVVLAMSPLAGCGPAIAEPPESRTSLETSEALLSTRGERKAFTLEDSDGGAPDAGGEAACGNGQDDDGDGLGDCADADCDQQTCGSGCVCQSFLPTETACMDAMDNDGDMFLDCADVDCNGRSCGLGCTCWGGTRREARCDDGLDNDRDVLTDCADLDCANKSCLRTNGSRGTCNGSLKTCM